jgi:hypothetical protein
MKHNSRHVSRIYCGDVTLRLAGGGPAGGLRAIDTTAPLPPVG